jgi:hypothetical protein
LAHSWKTSGALALGIWRRFPIRGSRGGPGGSGYRRRLVKKYSSAATAEKTAIAETDSNIGLGKEAAMRGECARIEPLIR